MIKYEINEQQHNAIIDIIKKFKIEDAGELWNFFTMKLNEAKKLEDEKERIKNQKSDAKKQRNTEKQKGNT